MLEWSHPPPFPPPPVGDWEACGDHFYCRELLYDMAWEEVDLEQRR
jgi:hypothetical protein